MSRRAQTLTSEQKALVASVRRIAKQRSRVNNAYIRSIIQAREAGVTYSAIAKVAGTSSQAVQEIVRRHAKAQEAADNSHENNAVLEAVDDSTGADAQQRQEPLASVTPITASGGQTTGTPDSEEVAGPSLGVAAAWAPAGQASPGE